MTGLVEEVALRESGVALVTGATQGLGRAVAACLHGLGWRVIVAGRDLDLAAATAASFGDRAAAVRLDVTSEESVRAAAAGLGAVDVLVNNAGVLLDAGTDPVSVPLADVERTIAVNVLGTWRVTKAFLPAMMRRGWGRVVMVSSGTGSFSNGLYTGTPGYSLSKTALNALTTMFAAHCVDSGVLVNAVNPGRVRTRMMPDAATSPEEAAAGVVAAVTLPDDGPTGRFLRDGEPIGW